MDGKASSKPPGGHRLEDVPLDQRYCNNCDEQILDEGNIGDLWWGGETEADAYVVILCRTCA